MNGLACLLFFSGAIFTFKVIAYPYCRSFYKLVLDLEMAYRKAGIEYRFYSDFSTRRRLLTGNSAWWLELEPNEEIRACKTRLIEGYQIGKKVMVKAIGFMALTMLLIVMLAVVGSVIRFMMIR